MIFDILTQITWQDICPRLIFSHYKHSSFFKADDTRVNFLLKILKTRGAHCWIDSIETCIRYKLPVETWWKCVESMLKNFQRVGIFFNIESTYHTQSVFSGRFWCKVNLHRLKALCWSKLKRKMLPCIIYFNLLFTPRVFNIFNKKVDRVSSALVKFLFQGTYKNHLFEKIDSY